MKIADPTVAYQTVKSGVHRWISNFQSVLINSKQIPKNIKFGLLAHFNMENKMNGSDRPFGFWKVEYWSNAPKPLCIAMHHSPSHIILYYILRGWLICFHKHLGRSATNPFSIFQNPNSRSEPFILFSILISAWRPNFTFFGIFLLFIKPLWKSLIQRWTPDFTVW